MTLNDHIMAGPLWLQSWVMWMVVINIAAILFLVRFKDKKPTFGPMEAFVIIGCMLVMAPSMEWLFGQVGYGRLLGSVHLVFWTPLLIFLWKRLHFHPLTTIFGKYLRILMATIGASLIVDAIDTIRHLLGDGALT